LENLDDEPDALIHSLRVPPVSIGQISLEYEIGFGGMGRVFKGYDTRLIRPVAVKLINAERQKEWKDLAERFDREVQMLARVESPYVVKALFAGEENGFTYFVQEYVDGKNLKERMEQLHFSMPSRACASIVYQVASGLTAVHKLGIVHRDIHPGNLLLNTKGNVQIADFGLAFEPEDRSNSYELTSLRQGFGQISYVSPEQWNAARNATTKSDIYSLGCVWYFLLTGHPLNRDTKTLEIINPSSQFQNIGRADRKLLKSMLELKPQQRPTAQEVVTALQSRLGAANSIEDILKKQSGQGPTKWKRYGVLASLTLLTLCCMIFLAFPSQDSSSTEHSSIVAPIAPHPLPAANADNQKPFALRFDGIDDFVETPFVYDSGEPITFEAWLTPDCEERPRNMEIVSNAETAGFLLRLKDGTMPEFLFHDGIYYAPHNRSRQIGCGKRVHIAAVYDGISIGMYVDGKKQGLNYPIRRRHRHSPIPIHLCANPDPALIGRPVAEKKACFAGLLHQCRFSKGAIYLDDFSPEKRLSSNDSTILLYHFNSDSGKIVSDQSGNGRDGKIVGATWEEFDPQKVPDKNDQFKWPAEMPDPVLVNDSPERIRQLQLAWADHLKLPPDLSIPMGNNSDIELALVPPGEFMMGTLETSLQSPDAAEKQKKLEPRILTANLAQQRTRITRPFYLSKTEISRKQFRQFVDQTRYRTDAEIDGQGGSDFKTTEMNPRITWASDLKGALSENHPATNLTWYDAKNFCSWLTRNQAQLVFDLPTESQWEYACRAGTTSMWYTSDRNQLSKYCWFQSTQTHPCGKLQPNAFGLHDMHGNVSEWCRDYFSTEESFSDSINNPTGPHSGTHRIIRGGSISQEADYCRSAYREGRVPVARDAQTGFRICATLNPETENLDSLDQFSLHFNGIDDTAEAVYDYRTRSDPLTIECWADIPAVTLNDQFASAVIFDLHSHLRALYCVLQNHRVHMYYRQGDWTWHAFSPVISAGNHHIAGVFDGTTLNIFVDGRIPENVSKQRAPREARYLRSTFRIGSSSMLENSQHHGFQGNISQLRISEKTVYNAAFQPPPLLTRHESTVALYRFEEGNGRILYDLSGMHNHARITGAEWSISPAPEKQLTNRGVRFDGDDWIESKLPDKFEGPFTIEAWVSPETMKKMAHQLLFQWGTLSLKYNVNNGEYWTWSLLDPQSLEVPVSTMSIRNVAINHPVHIACQWNGANWTMFLNGLPCQTLKMRDSQIARLRDIIESCQQKPLFIGGIQPSEKDVSHYFEGSMHALRISNIERYHKLFTPQDDFEIDNQTLLLYRFDEKTGETAHDSSNDKTHGTLHGAQWLAK
tara:strand:+ start:82994 stop:86995 length:4002 start_codon:yes stop_codon:yes gene_type:complete